VGYVSRLQWLSAAKEFSNKVSLGMLNTTLAEIRACTLCASELPLGPRPIVQAHDSAEILIIGQAPGLKVHQSGMPWDDASGDRLRSWLQMSKETFYGNRVALVPMGFCYPGRGKSGDLPPRKECADAWHEPLLARLANVKLTVLIGGYAQAKYLSAPRPTLTETVKDFRSYLPDFLPLPHPSPRNNIWLKKNNWFESEVLPSLRELIDC
jgi:uracil-DNA glycosylase